MEEQIKNYRLIESADSKDTNSKIRLYKHEKTGAQVLLLDNKDPNKVFSIGFLTPPINDTGVTHIVEHSTLSGSRKYRTKEPFMDLIQSSLQTFLNAMTFSDKTIYPVSSRNLKDFYNLMDVYLDAVFFPRMYEEKNIFLQEGWHYEFNEDRDLIYNGVVYNEMKGVYSDPDNVFSQQVTSALHGKTSYGYESGGHPAAIPKLKYEDFLDFHRTHYHPGNSFIYLYGDMDKAPILSYLDENYLSQFSPTNEDIHLNLAPLLKEDKEVHLTYPTEDVKNGSYYAYTVNMGQATSIEDSLLRDLVGELLVESNDGDIKEAFFEKNFCKDVYVEKSVSLPLDFSIVVKGAEPGKLDEFKEIIEGSLKKIISQGFDQDRLRASFNRTELSIREGGGIHKGIIYYINALNTWLYGESPIDSLNMTESLSKVKKKIERGYFEEVLQKKLLDQGRLLIESNPSPDLYKEEQVKIKKDLENFEKNLTTGEKAEILKEQRDLMDFQSKPDSKEAKDTIPKLSLEDLAPGVEKIPRTIDKLGDTEVLFHPQFTNGISYMTLCSSLGHLKKEDLPLVSILSSLLSRLSTKERTYKDLTTKIYLISAGLSFEPQVLQNQENYQLKFLARTSSLQNNIGESLELLQEVLTETRFDEEKRIFDLLTLERASNESSFLQNGHLIVSNRVESHYRMGSKVRDQISGLDYHFYLVDLLDHWDQRKEDFLKDLEDLYQRLLSSKDLLFEFTGSKEDYQLAKESFKNLESIYEPQEDQELNLDFSPKKEAFSLPASVVYLSKGYDLMKLGAPYSGSMAVLANLLSTGYLHENIRAKGGAYGAGLRIKNQGLLATYSYRDPNYASTLKSYDHMGQALEDMNLDEEAIEQMIIGSMNVFDPLRTPYDKGQVDLFRYILGETEETTSLYKQEALATSLKTLQSYKDILDQAMKEDHLVALGSKEILTAHKDDFDKIYEL